MSKLDWAKLRGISFSTETDTIKEISPFGIIFAEKVFHKNNRACRFVTIDKGSFSCHGYSYTRKLPNKMAKTEEINFLKNKGKKTDAEFKKFIRMLRLATKGSRLFLLGTIGGKETKLGLSELKKTDEFGGQVAGG